VCKQSPKKSRPWVTLFASMLVTFTLGSVHAFSVFVVPLESTLGLARSDVSLIYSFALIFITVSVLFGYRVYSLITAWQLVGMACIIAAAGLMLAANAKGWWGLFIGYSLLFGVSNGVGYGFTLQLVGRELPSIKGFAMGAVTAAYAVGSIVFAKIIAIQIFTVSITVAFMTLTMALLACSFLSASLMWFSRANYSLDKSTETNAGAFLDNRMVTLFWLAYMLSVFSGLMAIGHAAGISLSKGASLDQSIWAAMAIGVGSAGGGFLAGWLVDRWSISGFMIGLPLLSATALGSLIMTESPEWSVILLSVVGFAYGAIIAIYPVAISNYFGEQGARAYGRVFTAWGFAGLVAPWTAGLIYDAEANYQVALLVASLAAILSALTVRMGRL
jgi:OFA family oxalate/formate antiporter-like MFS transporter